MIFSQWAQLYTDTQYATMEFEAFKQLNLAAFYFDNTELRNECNSASARTRRQRRPSAQTAVQDNTPPLENTGTPPPRVLTGTPPPGTNSSVGGTNSGAEGVKRKYPSH